MHRWLVLSAAVPSLLACMGGRNAETTDDTADDVTPYLSDCAIRCEEDGIDLTIEASEATEAAVEFYYRADLVETFELSSIDDRTFIGFFEYPNGQDDVSCSSQDADWVCIARNGDQEVRESQ